MYVKSVFVICYFVVFAATNVSAAALHKYRAQEWHWEKKADLDPVNIQNSAWHWDKPTPTSATIALTLQAESPDCLVLGSIGKEVYVCQAITDSACYYTSVAECCQGNGILLSHQSVAVAGQPEVISFDFYSTMKGQSMCYSLVSEVNHCSDTRDAETVCQQPDTVCLKNTETESMDSCRDGKCTCKPRYSAPHCCECAEGHIATNGECKVSKELHVTLEEELLGAIKDVLESHEDDSDDGTKEHPNATEFLVECFTESGCGGEARTDLTNRECCVQYGEGVSFRVHEGDADVCATCVVFGWYNTSFAAPEQNESYTLQVGYLKGAGELKEDLEFNIVSDLGATVSPEDIKLETQRVNTTTPQDVKIKFVKDGVPQESNETFSLQLQLTESKEADNSKSSSNFFLIIDTQLTIIDSDEVCDEGVQVCAQGACTCREGYAGVQCCSCDTMYYKHPNDNTCKRACDGVDSCAGGVCTCNVGYSGQDCCSCDENYYRVGTECKRPCDIGVESCTGGVCACNVGYSGPDCCECNSGYYRDPSDGECKASCSEGTKSCVDGTCSCNFGFTGLGCCNCTSGYYRNSSSNSCQNPCKTGVESCTGGVCTCNVGYSGPDCCQCDSGYYRDPSDGECKEPCSERVQSCSGGTCTCNNGYIGLNCCQCDAGYYRDTSNEECRMSCTSGAINCVNGNCVCSANYTGLDCCSCSDNYFRDAIDGLCKSICTANAVSCTINGCSKCESGYDGPDCCSCAASHHKDPTTHKCQAVCDNGVESCIEDGGCTCKTGYTGWDCCDCLDHYYQQDNMCKGAVAISHDQNLEQDILDAVEEVMDHFLSTQK